MRYIGSSIQGWENFTNVAQDTNGVVLTTGGGLITHNLMNCMCLILTDGESRFGMLHISPMHPNSDNWIASMRTAVNAEYAIVCGGNSAAQDPARLTALVNQLAGLSVIDQTRDKWVPAALNPTPGSNTSIVGHVAVDASNASYAMTLGVGFPASTNAGTAVPRAARGSADGFCTIM